MTNLHHIGYVVDDIEIFKDSFFDLRLHKTVEDKLQNAKIELLSVSNGSYIELIQPLGPDAFTWNFLKKYGQGLHHLCFEGYSLSTIEKFIFEKKMIKLRGPIYASLFNKEVIFAMTRSRSIIEFIL
jgi:hypothetical protein